MESRNQGRKYKMKKTIAALLAAGTCLLLTPHAHADSIGLEGASKASGDSSKKSPTTVSFSNPWHVVSSDGIFAGTDTAAVTMASYSFTGDGTSAVCTNCPVVQWHFTYGGNTYSFTLTSLISATTRAGSLAASGTGTITVNSTTYSATWAMNGSGSKFKYRISFITNTVPDGGSAVALLGIALCGIEVTRRLIQRRQA